MAGSGAAEHDALPPMMNGGGGGGVGGMGGLQGPGDPPGGGSNKGMEVGSRKRGRDTEMDGGSDLAALLNYKPSSVTAGGQMARCVV